MRVEVLEGRALYAIRIVRSTPADFNLCPADLCQLPPAGAPAADASLAACPVGPAPGLVVSRYDAPADAVKTAEDLTRAASIDVGGVEYLVAADPFPPFADYITRRAR